MRPARISESVALLMRPDRGPKSGLTLPVGRHSRQIPTSRRTENLIPVPRWGAYQRNLEDFTTWVGPNAPIDALTAAKLEEYYAYLSGFVASGRYAPAYTRSLLAAAQQFIAWKSELELIPPPGNLRSRRFRFSKSQPQGLSLADLFTPGKFHILLAAAGERLRSFFLLMANCGMYQGDMSDLAEGEVDWQARTITRSRSKTGAQVVTYRLWPETFELLVKCRHKGNPAPKARGSRRVLVTGHGRPLRNYWIEDGMERRYDAVDSLYSGLKTLTGVKKPSEDIRKTSASELVKHPTYKFYAQYVLHRPCGRGVLQSPSLAPRSAPCFPPTPPDEEGRRRTDGSDR